MAKFGSHPPGAGPARGLSDGQLDGKRHEQRHGGGRPRSRGFTLPAAGKTGTSHDGWFAGFTSNLLAVAWVGYDDDRELKLTGADSALPIWTEFMKRATPNPATVTPRPFEAPPGIVTVPVQMTATLPSGGDRWWSAKSTLSRELSRRGKRPAGGRGILSRLFHSGNTAAAPVGRPVPPGGMRSGEWRPQCRRLSTT